MKGWECPKCGKGLAPWVKECDCIQITKPALPNYDPWPGYIRPTPTYPGPYDNGWWGIYPPWTIYCEGISDTTMVIK